VVTLVFVVSSLRGFLGSLQFSCGCVPQSPCKGFGEFPQYHRLVERASLRGLLTGEQGEPPWCWSTPCHHTSPTKTYFPSKGRNYGNTSLCLRSPLLGYFFPLLAYLLTCLLSYLLACHLGNSPSCTSSEFTLCQALKLKKVRPLDPFNWYQSLVLFDWA
jgi:hypothetical protein